MPPLLSPAYSIPGNGIAAIHVVPPIVNILNTTYTSVIVHSNVERSPITIGEGDDGVFDIIHIFPFEFSRLIFRKHRQAPKLIRIINLI